MKLNYVRLVKILAVVMADPAGDPLIAGGHVPVFFEISTPGSHLE